MPLGDWVWLLTPLVIPAVFKWDNDEMFEETLMMLVLVLNSRSLSSTTAAVPLIWHGLRFCVFAVRTHYKIADRLSNSPCCPCIPIVTASLVTNAKPWKIFDSL